MAIVDRASGPRVVTLDLKEDDFSTAISERVFVLGVARPAKRHNNYFRLTIGRLTISARAIDFVTQFSQLGI